MVKFFKRLFHNVGLEKRLNNAIADAKMQNNPSQRIGYLHLKLDTELEKLDSVCSKGCSSCCHQVVNILKDESIQINKYIEEKYSKEQLQTTKDLAKEYIKKVNQSFENQPYSVSDFIRKNEYEDCYKGTQCPFLHKDTCSIYDVRPIECRAFLSIKNPAACSCQPGTKSNPNPNWVARKIRIKTIEKYFNVICNRDISKYSPLIFELDNILKLNMLRKRRSSIRYPHQ